MTWNLGSFFNDVFVDESQKEGLKNDTKIKEQEMTPEEQKLLASQMKQYSDLEKLGPVALAQMGYIKDPRTGRVRGLTDQEARKMLAPDQYQLYRARQADALALGNNTLPDYMKREMDAANSQILGAANKRLGPGGYYMSTPGENATRLVAQNVADTTAKNRERQLGLMSGYYGLNANIANQLPQYGAGLIGAGQSIAKNMIQPFHEWSSSNRETYSKGLAGLGQQGIGALGQVGSSAMGMFKGK